MVKLSGGDRATFRTNPSKSVEVEMAVIVAHEDAAFARCSALVATSSEGRTSYGPFRARRLGAGTEAAVSLTTKTTVESLHGLLSDRDIVTLEGCGQSWKLHPVQTDSLRSLVNTARDHAPEHAAPAAPSAPSAEQTAPESNATPAPGAGAPDAPLAPAEQALTPPQQPPPLPPQAPSPPPPRR